MAAIRCFFDPKTIPRPSQSQSGLSDSKEKLNPFNVVKTAANNRRTAQGTKLSLMGWEVSLTANTGARRLFCSLCLLEEKASKMTLEAVVSVTLRQNYLGTEFVGAAYLGIADKGNCLPLVSTVLRETGFSGHFLQIKKIRPKTHTFWLVPSISQPSGNNPVSLWIWVNHLGKT